VVGAWPFGQISASCGHATFWQLLVETQVGQQSPGSVISVKPIAQRIAGHATFWQLELLQLGQQAPGAVVGGCPSAQMAAIGGHATPWQLLVETQVGQQ